MLKKKYTPLFYWLLLILPVVVCCSCRERGVQSAETILVTAPDIYNNRLSSLINKAGKIAIPFPVIETSLIVNNAEIDSVLFNVKHYDWIVFSSRNAIKAYFTRTKELGIELERLTNNQYCAIGKDQEYLKSFGVTTILENTESSPQGIVDAIKLQEHSDKSIAVLAPLVVGMPEPDVVPNFIDSLDAIELNVTRVNAYTVRACYPHNLDSVIAEIQQGNIDLIAFTSTSEIEAMLQLVGGEENLSQIAIACFGPYTFSNAEKLGLKPSFMAKDFSSFGGYVEAIVHYFK